MCDAKKGDIVRPTANYLFWQPAMKGIKTPLGDREYFIEGIITNTENNGEGLQFIISGDVFHHANFILVKTAEDHAREVEKKMQQSVQRTKRIVPTCREHWEKVVGLWVDNDAASKFHIILDEKDAAGCYFNSNGKCFTFLESIDDERDRFSKVEVEIPVTTKRIPFDASRKDAKVVFKGEEYNCLISAWYVMPDGQIAVGGIAGDRGWSGMYYQSDLEMEIEE